ncbi:MAG: hypothetical protein WD845_14910 [Pirellulales bacterium]
MSAKRSTAETSESPAKSRARRPLLGHSARWMAIAGVIAVVTSGVAYGVWRQVRTHVLASSQYNVDPQQIIVTPAPSWIRSNVKEEVLREASISGPLSLLEAQLTPRVAGAFAAHPWIAGVERVSKRFPAGLEVEVTYRRPVAMVEVPDGALPVDVAGVVLPTTDFQPGEADKYPRVGGVQTAPAGLCGSEWGDAAVVGGAQIAAVLANDWQALDLFRIMPSGRKPGGRGGVEYTFALFTRGGTRIDWGLAPGTTVNTEPPATDKVHQLRQYAATNGSLDGETPQQIRFADGGKLEVTPREPVAPLPARD